MLMTIGWKSMELMNQVINHTPKYEKKYGGELIYKRMGRTCEYICGRGCGWHVAACGPVDLWACGPEAPWPWCHGASGCGASGCCAVLMAPYYIVFLGRLGPKIHCFFSFPIIIQVRGLDWVWALVVLFPAFTIKAGAATRRPHRVTSRGSAGPGTAAENGKGATGFRA